MIIISEIYNYITYFKDLGLDHCSWAVTDSGLVRTKGQQVDNFKFSTFLMKNRFFSSLENHQC